MYRGSSIKEFHCGTHHYALALQLSNRLAEFRDNIMNVNFKNQLDFQKNCSI